jgi:hypothetical protein
VVRLSHTEGMKKMNTNNRDKIKVKVKHSPLCNFCDPGKNHRIDPDNYPNDTKAVLTDSGYKCGNCVERELDDIFLSSAPYSDPKRYQEIKEKRKREEITKR